MVDARRGAEYRLIGGKAGSGQLSALREGFAPEVCRGAAVQLGGCSDVRWLQVIRVLKKRFSTPYSEGADGHLIAAELGGGI